MSDEAETRSHHHHCTGFWSRGKSMTLPNTTPQGKMQFINVSEFPVAKHSLPSRRAIHSHAARTRHAKARHARTKQYQEEKRITMQQQRCPSESGEYASTTLQPGSSKSATRASGIAAELSRNDTFAPRLDVGLLASSQRDLSMAFNVNLEPTDNFLLDHCK
jgi:hypothetical protein